MKISFQWILAAIVVLLVIVVGAFALTNGNHAPANNATATPVVTVTATATPVASPSSSPTSVATATPAATTKPTPTATPTITGSNGVHQTSFGYYITYPPFSENQVNVNPNYVISNGSPAITPTPTSTPSATPNPAQTTVAFQYSDGGLASTKNFMIYNLHDWNYYGDYMKCNISLVRTGSLDGAVTAYVDMTYYSPSTNEEKDTVMYTSTVTFQNGQSTALMLVGVNMDDLGIGPYTVIYQIQPDDSYNVGSPSEFTFHPWSS